MDAGGIGRGGLRLWNDIKIQRIFYNLVNMILYKHVD